MLARGCVFAAAALIAFLAGRGIWNLRETRNTGYQNMQLTKYIADTPDYRVELLTINEYSRPGLAIDAVNGIVVHYTANPGTTAEQNRGYFEGLAESGETYSSSHFIIGLDGEIIQCIPCNEIAYASNERNSDTISIECCIPDETGEFSDATYDALVELVTWLMGRYDLDAEDVIRHYDVTGKNCPKYFVEHEAAWQQFHNDLLAYIDRYGIAKTEEIK
jgi:N-acetylmuramoyl-L-alanine amidase CwlA